MAENNCFSLFSAPQSLLDDKDFQARLKQLSEELKLMAAAGKLPPGVSESKTVITSVKAVNAVVAGSDGQATMSDLRKAQLRFAKLFPIDSHAVIGTTGVATWCRMLARYIEEILVFDQDICASLNGIEFDIDSRKGRLSALLLDFLPVAINLGLVALPLLSIADKKTGECRIFSFDLIGGAYEPEKNFEAEGCGKNSAKEVFGGAAEKIMDGISTDEAVELTVRAVAKSIEENGGCGGKISVCVVDKSGIRFIPQSEIGQICRRLGPRKIGNYGNFYPYEQEERR